MKLSDYSNTDAIGLGKIDGKAFTIMHLEKGQYDDHGNMIDSVMITTKQTFEVEIPQSEGTPKLGKFDKFYTTRKAICSTLLRSDIFEAVNSGQELGPVKCVMTKTKTGRDIYVLKDV